MTGLAGIRPGSADSALHRAEGMWQRTVAVAPALAWTGLAMLLASLPTLLLSTIDPRLLQGVSVWLKPWKFQVSSGVYLLTLAAVFVWLPRDRRRSWAWRYVVWAGISSALFEVGYITWQAARGQASHFNVSTPFTAAMYSLMGFGAVVLTSTALVQGLMVLRSRRFALTPTLRQAIGWGLVLTFALGTAFGGYLGGQSTGHWVGGSLSDGQGLAVVKWSRDGGDLRVAHFFGVHAVHFIVLFAVLVERVAGVPADAAGDARGPTRWVWAFCAAYVCFTVWTFVQAVRGQAFLA